MAEPIEATVLVFDKSIHIGYTTSSGQPITIQWAIDEVEVSPHSINRGTRIRHAVNTGMELEIEDAEAGNNIRALQQEHTKPWHQQGKLREWSKNLLIFLGVMAGLVILYFLVVPWLSEKMASRVSVETEQGFGEAVYSALAVDLREDTAASREANQFFAAMNVPSDYTIRITVARGTTVNAFALPGGRIVVYTALLDKMKTYPELAALLSHEFTHVNNRHSTKSIFRRLGSRVFLGLLFGKFGSVTSILVDNADNLKSLTYSRKLEKEADLDGLQILKTRKIDPRGFADLFHHLKQSTPGSGMPELLGSHPDISKRIAYIKEASAGASVEENPRLKVIFEKLKQSIQ